MVCTARFLIFGILLFLFFFRGISQSEEESDCLQVTDGSFENLFRSAEDSKDQYSRKLFCQKRDSSRRITDLSGELSTMTPAISKLQSVLEPEEVILEYNDTAGVLQLFLISATELYFRSVPYSENARNDLALLIRKLKSGDFMMIHKLSKIQSAYLLHPVRDQLRKFRRLIVIPSANLSLLSFEVLESPSGKGILLEEIEVVYQTSAWRWLLTRTTTHSDHFPTPEDHCWAFAGLAPVFGNEPDVVTLPGTRGEMDDVGLMLTEANLAGQITHENYASEARLRLLTGLSRIVHLATHVIPDPEGKRGNGLLLRPSGPEFGDDGIQSLSECYEMQVKSDLIVLNTCSSATGPLMPGEGITSIARGFLQAGAPHVLGTLWSISDLHAREMVVAFYRYSMKGETFTKALQRAKLDFLHHEKSSNPLFWAPYIIFGD